MNYQRCKSAVVVVVPAQDLVVQEEALQPTTLISPARDPRQPMQVVAMVQVGLLDLCQAILKVPLDLSKVVSWALGAIRHHT